MEFKTDFVPSIISLSPKKKSKKMIENEDRPLGLSKSNFELVNMPMRTEKPFQKIPNYNQS